MYDTREVRRDFPILDRRVGELKLVYLDNAATSQKPRQVLDTLNEYYEEHNANIHRGVHRLAEEATALYEGSRERVARFLGAPDVRGLIFTRGTTESINLVAHAWGRKNLREGDEILLTEAEHHSNLVPWQLAARATGAGVREWAWRGPPRLGRIRSRLRKLRRTRGRWCRSFPSCARAGRCRTAG